jgi:hypothetical protein
MEEPCGERGGERSVLLFSVLGCEWKSPVVNVVVNYFRKSPGPLLRVLGCEWSGKRGGERSVLLFFVLGCEWKSPVVNVVVNYLRKSPACCLGS